MRLNLKTLYFIFSFSGSICISLIANADPIFRVNDGYTAIIEKFSACQEVQNDSGYPIMVPTGTEPEWDSFTNHLPSNVALNSCPAFDGQVLAIAKQPDGKIIVGGNFSNYGPYAAAGLIRLNSDTSYDASFDCATCFDGGEPHSIIADTSGIYIVGAFNSLNGNTTALYGFVKLNSSGGYDSAYDANIALQIDAGGSVDFMTLQPTSGTMVLAGTFVDQGRPVSIIRLYTTGFPDGTFITNAEATGYGDAAILSQPDDKILVDIGSHIKRLTAAGAIDSGYTAIPFDSFSWSGDPCNGGVFNIDYGFHLFSPYQPDGNAVLYGDFQINGSGGESGVATISSTGTVVNNYTSIASVNVPPANLNDGTVLVAKDNCNHGQYDISQLSGGHPTQVGTLDGQISALLVDGNDTLFVGGIFSTYTDDNTTTNYSALRPNLFRIQPDGVPYGY